MVRGRWYNFPMITTIDRLTDVILVAAESSDDQQVFSNAIEDMRRCHPELVEVAIRSAMQQSPAAEEWIREKFLDVLFPFSAKARPV